MLQSISSADWLNAGVNFLGILIAFVAGSIIIPRLNDRRARREARERLLGRLLFTRVDAGNLNFLETIALVRLEFAHSRSVKTAYSRYLFAVNRAGFNEYEKAALRIEISKQLDELISAMAADLKIDLTGHEGNKYLSLSFVEREDLQHNARVALIRIAESMERREADHQPSPQHEDPDGE